METKFYLGSLELTYFHESELATEDFDKCFNNKVLPIKNKIDIFIHEFPFTQELQQILYNGNHFTIFLEDKKEYRIYTGKKDNEIVSSFNLENRVHLYLPTNIHTSIQKLRPWFNIHLEELLLFNEALILHSASIEFNDNSILFTAPSGTGKTTQTELWHKFKKNVSDINGDRTLIQLFENNWYACGFPIHGSSVKCKQAAVPIKVIVVLKQGKQNCIRKLTSLEKISALYSEIITFPYNKDFINMSLDLLENLIKNVDVIELSCKPNKEAVDILHKYLYE